jgi:hypothetical protein
MGHTWTMSKTEPQKKIVSETFLDEKGNVIDDPKKAATIEVIEELPDGTRMSHILVSTRK